jgi:hypothetical protein
MAKCFYLAVIGGGLGGGGTTAQSAHVDVSLSTYHQKEGILGQAYLDRQSIERKSTFHGTTQQDSNKILVM